MADGDEDEAFHAHVAEVLRRHGIRATEVEVEMTVDLIRADAPSSSRLPAAGTVMANYQEAAPLARTAIARRSWLAGVLDGVDPGRLSASAVAEGYALTIRMPLQVTPPPGEPVEVPVLLGTVPGLREAVADAYEDGARSAASGFLSAVGPPLRAAMDEVAASFVERVADYAAALGDDLATVFCDTVRRNASGGLSDFRAHRSVAAERLKGLLASRFDRATMVFSQALVARDFQRDAGYHDYPALFPLARGLSRRITLIVGPTNSGKTHKALGFAMAAPTARVLSPLRLLALEHYEKLRDAGLSAGMVTGEELLTVEGATHVSHTVETAPLSQVVDVGVIDEVQMLADRERGWAWTQAIVGMPARHLVLNGSPDAIRLVTRIAAYLEEPLDVVTLERLSPLRAMDAPVPMSEVRAGDALVAFSRREVYAIREDVVARGLSVATVYGALSPEVRRAEARRFRDGEADVLVATDAIGMGLNIGPLRRVIFTALHKYDGERERDLTDYEIRQIAGRAGRYGMQEVGHAGVLDGQDPSKVSRALGRRPVPIAREKLLVRPSVEAVRLGVARFGIDRLGPLLERLVPSLVRDSEVLEMASLDEMLDVSSLLSSVEMPAETAFHYAVSPVDRRHPLARAQIRRWASEHMAGRGVDAPRFRVDELDALEFASKTLTLYLWLGRRFPEVYGDRDAALDQRAAVDAGVERILVETSRARQPTRMRGRGRKASRAT